METSLTNNWQTRCRRGEAACGSSPNATRGSGCLSRKATDGSAEPSAGGLSRLGAGGRGQGRRMLRGVRAGPRCHLKVESEVLSAEAGQIPHLWGTPAESTHTATEPCLPQGDVSGHAASPLPASKAGKPGWWDAGHPLQGHTRQGEGKNSVRGAGRKALTRHQEHTVADGFLQR